MHRRARSPYLSLVLALGCRAEPPVQPEPSPAEPAAQPPEVAVSEPERPAVLEPACVVTVDEHGQLTVGGRVIPSDAFWQPAWAGEARVRSFPHRADAILLALGTNYPWAPYAGEFPSGTLWELPCDRPEDIRTYERIDGADFAWAELSRDGASLFYSDGAVRRYDIARRESYPVTAPPRIAECWMAEGPIGATEYVVGWVGDDRLLIYWGGPCGFEAQWLGGTAVIEDPGGAATRRTSAHVGSIVVDASGQVWVGNGGRCADEIAAWDRGTPGIWRSDDVGASWTFVPIAALAKQPHGVAAISTNGARISVDAECCYAYGEDECSVGGERMYSDDGGRTWKHASPASATAPESRSVTIGEWVLEATHDGVIKRRVDEPSGVGETVLLPGIDPH
ncbi:MAG TPA: hypothetical protein VM869_33825 [Enhygromyxa sp.]|nr:hypothetical protein [Enhygromyxa sp.]